MVPIKGHILLQPILLSPKPPAADINQLVTRIAQNRVYVDTINPPKGFNYEAMLDNKRNARLMYGKRLICKGVSFLIA